MTFFETTSLIAAVSSTIAAFGVYFLYKQLKADRERSRRENAIDLMKWWNSEMSRRCERARLPSLAFVNFLNKQLNAYLYTILRI